MINSRGMCKNRLYVNHGMLFFESDEMMYVSRVRTKHCDWATENSRQLHLCGFMFVRAKNIVSHGQLKTQNQGCISQFGQNPNPDSKSKNGFFVSLAKSKKGLWIQWIRARWRFNGLIRIRILRIHDFCVSLGNYKGFEKSPCGKQFLTLKQALSSIDGKIRFWIFRSFRRY